MKTSRYFGAFLLLTTSVFANAQEAEFILGLDLGRNSINIDQEFAIIDTEFDSDGYSLGYVLGYRWENNLVAEANIAYASNDSFFRAFDYYETSEIKLMLGYSFEIAEHLRIVPMLGFSRWELETKEGRLFNPGPEEQKEFDGTDLTYKVRMDFPVGQLVVLSLSYAKSELDASEIAITQFGIKFEF